MKRGRVFLGFILIFLAVNLVSSVSANVYYIEYNQVQDKLVIKESVNGGSLSSYVDSVLLGKSGSELYFVKRLTFNQSFDEVQIKLNLDRGIIVKDNLVFPTGYRIETDGQIISVSWSINNAAAGQDFAMFVTLEDTSYSSSLIYWIIGLLILFVLGSFAYKQFGRKLSIKKTTKSKSKTRKKKAASEDVYDYLLDTEKKVIEELKKADRNELWQKQIQLVTGYSKAKVSRLVRNLEARGLVTKIPFGNTNKIRLK